MFDSFGGSAALTNNAATVRYLYTGKEADTELGSYYYRARQYSPDAGRFLSEDPIGFGGEDVNLFRYVLNAPAALRDPSGLSFDSPLSYSEANIRNLQAETWNSMPQLSDIYDGFRELLRQRFENDQFNKKLRQEWEDDLMNQYYEKTLRDMRSCGKPDFLRPSVMPSLKPRPYNGPQFTKPR